MDREPLLTSDREDRPLYERIGSALWRNKVVILLCGLLLVGGTFQQVCLPLWLEYSFPYFVVFFSSLIYVIFFGVSSLVYKLAYNPPSVPFFDNLMLYLVIGFFDALNGILIVWASPPNRTPPILQSLFGNISILYSMLAVKLFVRPDISYLYKKPIAALILLAIAVLLSLMPDILSIARGESSFSSGNDSLAWTIIFLVGVGPGAVYNVVQEKFLQKRKMVSMEYDKYKKYDMQVMLFWGCFFQLVVMGLFFWVDILPWYGLSSNLQTFGENFHHSIVCYFGGDGCPPKVWIYGLLFNLGYTMSYIGGVGLNEDSANFNMIAGMMVTPFSILYWVIFPNVDNPVPEWWSFVIPLFLFSAASYFWKSWEKESDQEDSLRLN